MSNQYYSHGKLLITGEYFVLEGSLALAVPLKLGQSMVVTSLHDSRGELTWETHIKNELWFQAVFNLRNLEITKTNISSAALYLQKLLLAVKRNSNVLSATQQDLSIKTNLEFPLEWGLGSSSSLISNLAYWSNTNPYQLLSKTSEGSGYDIACARSNGSIFYRIQDTPSVTEARFNPTFLENIYFVYLGRKQNSLSSVQQYWDKIKGKTTEAEAITEISNSIIHSKTLKEFENHIVHHESIISSSLNTPTVKSQYFSDFKGSIKSLGAWGGDFIMATSHGNSEYVAQYFHGKGLNIIFPYKKLVL
jgi:mevalonate kinase